MIRRLHIERWRAFENLTLELDEGVTFVVAENGIGKTSLIEAASWGLFGSLSNVDAHAASRFGNSDVHVKLDLELPDGELLTVERSMSGQAATLQARLDGAAVEEIDLRARLAAAFGASPKFLSRTTLLSSTAVADHSASISELHQHLCHVFGVDELQHAAELLRRAHSTASAEAKRHRQQARRIIEDLDQLRQELLNIDQAVQSAELTRAKSRDAVEEAQRRIDQVRAMQAARTQAHSDLGLLQELLAETRTLLESHESVDHLLAISEMAAATIELRRRLEEAETSATRRADQDRAELAVITAQLSVAQGGMSKLHDAADECPVCRRELRPEDREAAQRRHERDIDGLLARQRRIQASMNTATQRLRDTRLLASRAARLRLPDAPSASVDDTVVALDLDAAMQSLEEAHTLDEERLNHAADMRAERSSIQRRIRAAETLAEQDQESLLAHRREAAANIAAQTMAATADAILTERIDPLVAEIAHRWKRVFVNRGELRLRHDGRLVLHRGAHDIGFEQLSSGEKVIALLATRLLVLSSSTRASFLWLDEPLEHLDPSNRRLAASLMATSGVHTRQLLVTTYEERLARQLAATETAAIHYIKATSDN